MIKPTQPPDWPADAPPYNSLAGWEYEKALALEKIKKQFNIK